MNYGFLRTVLGKMIFSKVENRGNIIILTTYTDCIMFLGLLN
jgi:hypothetical protein